MVDPLASRIREYQAMPRVRERGGYWMAEEHPQLVRLIADWQALPENTTVRASAWLDVEEYLRKNLK